MATIGGLVSKSLGTTGPGLGGTMPPEQIGARLLQSSGPNKVIPEEKGWLPNWSRWPAAIASPAISTIGSLIAKVAGKPLFTEPRRIQGMTYQERAGDLAIELKDKGYSQEDIQIVLDILAQGYGEEPINASDAGDVSGPLGGGVRK